MQGQIQQRTERNIFAFDLSREAIQIASKKDKRKAVKWFVTDLSKIPLKDGSMDCILDIFFACTLQRISAIAIS